MITCASKLEDKEVLKPTHKHYYAELLLTKKHYEHLCFRLVYLLTRNDRLGIPNIDRIDNSIIMRVRGKTKISSTESEEFKPYFVGNEVKIGYWWNHTIAIVRKTNLDYPAMIKIEHRESNMLIRFLNWKQSKTLTRIFNEYSVRRVLPIRYNDDEQEYSYFLNLMLNKVTNPHPSFVLPPVSTPSTVNTEPPRIVAPGATPRPWPLLKNTRINPHHVENILEKILQQVRQFDVDFKLTFDQIQSIEEFIRQYLLDNVKSRDDQQEIEKLYKPEGAFEKLIGKIATDFIHDDDGIPELIYPLMHKYLCKEYRTGWLNQNQKIIDQLEMDCYLHLRKYWTPFLEFEEQIVRCYSQINKFITNATIGKTENKSDKVIRRRRGSAYVKSSSLLKLKRLSVQLACNALIEIDDNYQLLSSRFPFITRYKVKHNEEHPKIIIQGEIDSDEIEQIEDPLELSALYDTLTTNIPDDVLSRFAFSFEID